VEIPNNEFHLRKSQWLKAIIEVSSSQFCRRLIAVNSKLILLSQEVPSFKDINYELPS